MNLSIPQINRLQGHCKFLVINLYRTVRLLIGAIADGVSEIHFLAQCSRPSSTLSCIKQLGIDIEERDQSYSSARKRHAVDYIEPLTPLDAGNSGTTMRFFQVFSLVKIFIHTSMAILLFATTDETYH